MAAAVGVDSPIPSDPPTADPPTDGDEVVVVDRSHDNTEKTAGGAHLHFGDGGVRMIRFDRLTRSAAEGGDKIKVFDTGSFLRGVRVATGDVNGESTPEIIAGTGPGGGPHVRVFDSTTGSGEGQFQGGVFVAAGDLNGDGASEIVTGVGAGRGPHIRVFTTASGLDPKCVDEYFDANEAGEETTVDESDTQVITFTGLE